ncbi:MAG: GIY-YIG nuclease family protein [bacterium]|nr:GIY-YIG nuclease family protein [bacterium]
MKSESFKKIKIPSNPGVYFFRKGSEILYIGKATELKSRVKSYFSEDLIETRGPVIFDMVFKADNLKWQVTDSVLEALILEAELIKKYQPKYNTKEKDDKSFNYVIITKEKLPKVVIVRGKKLQEQESFSRFTLPRVRGGTYTTKNFLAPFASTFGPFPNGSQLKEALKIIRRIFPHLDDKSKNYVEFYRQINLVPDLNDHKMYLENIKNIKLFFQGKKKRILQNLKKEMRNYAKAREFEKAGEIKRQIFALQHINDVSLLKLEPSAYSLVPISRIEAYDIAHMSGKNMVGVMTVVENGNPVKSEYKKFKIRTQRGSNDTGALKEILNRRLAHPEWPYPDIIVVDGGVAQMNAARGVFNLVGVKIPIVSVVKDERHRAKEIKGDKKLVHKYEHAILLANSEAHRFAIAYHKNMRAKNFLNRK